MGKTGRRKGGAEKEKGWNRGEVREEKEKKH